LEEPKDFLELPLAKEDLGEKKGIEEVDSIMDLGEKAIVETDSIMDLEEKAIVETESIMD
jgi:hypothetical protein